jgi:DNA-binding response OmpR family regulator
LVVTSRMADEALWAEVLNMGGYDVLAQPLDTEEVTRVIGAALRRMGNERERESRQAHPVLISTAN